MRSWTQETPPADGWGTHLLQDSLFCCWMWAEEKQATCKNPVDVRKCPHILEINSTYKIVQITVPWQSRCWNRQTAGLYAHSRLWHQRWWALLVYLGLPVAMDDRSQIKLTIQFNVVATNPFVDTAGLFHRMSVSVRLGHAEPRGILSTFQKQPSVTSLTVHSLVYLCDVLSDLKFMADLLNLTLPTKNTTLCIILSVEWWREGIIVRNTS